MTSRRRPGAWIWRIALLGLGWLLVVAGIIALAVPGPGLLTLAAGMVILSQEYDWAARRVEPVKKRAFDAARVSVQSWPRLALSTLGACWLVGIGIVWGIGPMIPTWWLFGPRLPFAGWGVGVSLIVSGLAAFTLLGYSLYRFRGERGRGRIR